MCVCVRVCACARVPVCVCDGEREREGGGGGGGVGEREREREILRLCIHFFFTLVKWHSLSERQICETLSSQGEKSVSPLCSSLF